MAEVIEKKATAEKAPVVSDAVKALAGVFEKSVKPGENGALVVEGDLVADNLPEGLTMADIKKVQKFRGEVIAATTLALGKVGLPVLKKDKAAERVSLDFKFGSDKVSMALEREREFNDGNGGKLKKFGYINLGYTASGATNAGEFKKARQSVAAEATTLFG